MLIEITRLYSAGEARELDRIAIQERGVPGILLMKRAGQAVFKALQELSPAARSVSVVCGKGNNAGDGYIVAGLARQRGLEVSLFQLGHSSELGGDAATARDWAVEQGVEPLNCHSAQDLNLSTDVIVDALLGTGIRGAVRSPYAEAIAAINLVASSSKRKVLAVDIPSGLSADTGGILGCAVGADVSVTFIAAKRGLFTAKGPECAGKVLLDDLEVAPDIINRVPGIAAMNWAQQAAVLPRRRATTYKHACGHLVVCGGDEGMGGAVAMAAETALRVGTGMVTVLTRKIHVPALLARRPELMVLGVEEAETAENYFSRATAIVVGPGLGRSEWSRSLLRKALQANKPLLIDADALNLLVEEDFTGLLSESVTARVLTPHPGEAARLLGVTPLAIEEDRFVAVADLSQRYQAVAVLKGPGTLVANAATRHLALCKHGNPAMASAGMGDVLSGVIGGFMAQGLPATDAARVGVCLHSCAADRWVAAEGERGMIATDLLPMMAELFNADSRSVDA